MCITSEQRSSDVTADVNTIITVNSLDGTAFCKLLYYNTALWELYILESFCKLKVESKNDCSIPRALRHYNWFRIALSNLP